MSSILIVSAVEAADVAIDGLCKAPARTCCFTLSVRYGFGGEHAPTN